jgi:Tfp pilus assembly protein PilN
MSLNLASQPFVNSRPMRRLVFVLWCLSALLVGANLFFYARHFSGQQERRDRLKALAEQESGERQRLAELEREMAGVDLEWQNSQVEFLNTRIAERVFPWSRLFDRLTKVLPPQVRLTRLRPKVEHLARGPGGPEETVSLEIRGEARQEQAILTFISRLFEHPAFRAPNLSSESRRARADVTEFTLSVTYLPAQAESPKAAVQPQPAAGVVESAAEEEGGEG